MRQFAIFVVTFPFLLFAILWVPVGMFATIFFAPIWGMLGLVMMLRGQDGGWGIFLLPSIVMLDMYLEITGFCPQLARAIDRAVLS